VRARQAGIDRERREASLPESCKATGGAYPESIVAVAGDRPHFVDGQAVIGCVVREAAITPAVQTSTISADPQRAVAIFEQAQHVVAREALARCVAREASVAETREPATVGGDPKRACRVLEEGGDMLIADLGRVGGVEYREARPIEPHGAFVGPEPEIAVACGRQGQDGVLRQPVLFLPGELLIAAVNGVRRHRLRGGGAGEHVGEEHHRYRGQPHNHSNGPIPYPRLPRF
jgi:hypothetical protein